MRGNKFYRAVDNFLGPIALRALSPLRKRKAPPRVISSIGLLCCTPIGDLVVSLGGVIPAIRSKFPGVRVVIFCAEYGKEALNILPAVEEVRVVDPKKIGQAILVVNRANVDVLIDFSQWVRFTSILSAFAFGAYTIGFFTQGQRRHYAYDRCVEHRSDVHEFVNYSNLVSAVGVTRVPFPNIDIGADFGLNFASRLVDRRYVVFHLWPSGINKELKEWPVENWRSLAEKFITKGYLIVFTGGKGDSERTKMVLGPLVGKRDGHVINLSGAISLRETAKLIKDAAALISVNTGIMHIGAALGVPLAALHGPTNPKRWGPLSERAVVFVPPGPGSAYLNLGWEYPPDAKNTMHHISVDEVYEGVVSIMK